MKKNRVPVEGSAGDLEENAFAGLDSGHFPAGSKVPQQSVPEEPVARKTPNLGRVEVRREISGRAGKAVTTIREFRAGSSKATRTELLRELKKKLAVGGFLRPDGGLEVQGDHRERVMAILVEKGYRPVQAGG